MNGSESGGEETSSDGQVSMVCLLSIDMFEVIRSVWTNILSGNCFYLSSLIVIIAKNGACWIWGRRHGQTPGESIIVA